MSASFAGGTNFQRLGPAATAFVATDSVINCQRDGYSSKGLLKCEFHSHKNVLSPCGVGHAFGARSKDVTKNIAEIKRTSISSSSEPFEASELIECGPSTIILRALLGVAEHGISLVEFFEFFF